MDTIQTRDLVPALLSNDLDWMNGDLVELRIQAGTLVESELNETVTLAGDVYAIGRREESGSWVYMVRDRRYRCAGGLAHSCGVLETV